MQLTDDEVRELKHRPLCNLLSQIIMSVGQPMPHYYMQRPDGSLVDILGSNGCAAFVSRILASMGAVAGQPLIDGPHNTVHTTVRTLQAAGWQLLAGSDEPKPGDVILWEAQQQADGVHSHIGFYIGNDEAVSTWFVDMIIKRHSVTFDGSRKIDQLLRYPWSVEEYDALTHLNVADGSAV